MLINELKKEKISEDSISGVTARRSKTTTVSGVEICKMAGFGKMVVFNFRCKFNLDCIKAGSVSVSTPITAAERKHCSAANNSVFDVKSIQITLTSFGKITLEKVDMAGKK